MSQRIKEFEVELEDAIEVHVKGQPVETTTVLLKAPSAKNRKEAFGMKQIFARAVKSMQSDAPAVEQAQAAAENAESPKGEEILMMILASDQDFDLFNDQFRKILCNGCALVSGEKMNDHLYSLLSLDDAEKLLAEYLEHFLMKSLLQ